MAKLDIITGYEGSRHDPYSWSEIHFTKTDGTVVVGRESALGYVRVSVNGEQIAESFHDDYSADDKFEELVGLSLARCEKLYYDRFHVEDYMGSASLYL